LHMFALLIVLIPLILLILLPSLTLLNPLALLIQLTILLQTLYWSRTTREQREPLTATPRHAYLRAKPVVLATRPSNSNDPTDLPNLLKSLTLNSLTL
jgi:hypothetical protein